MKQWKTWQIALFVLLCVMLNYGGRVLATRLSLPLWMDSFGTVLCAYAGGPVCGAIVGVSVNVLASITLGAHWAYALTSIALGLLVGIAARNGMLKTLFGTLSISAIAALVSIFISVPLNLLLHGGSTGNLWGDGVIGFLTERHVIPLICAIAGEFYLDFLDKTLTLLALFLLIKLFRYIRNKPAGAAEKAALSVLFLLLIAIPAVPARGEADAEPIDYNDYVQTVYSSNNGLPCGEANDIAQTSDGLLWIGAYNGLYRYNGREFRRQDLDSVFNVNCLYVDEEGRLWIGSNDNGLSILIDEKVVSVVDEADGLPANSVRSIVESSDGYYYIGTSGSMQVLTLNSGLKKFNTLWEISECEKSAADDKGHVAAVTSDGRLFLMERGRIVSALNRMTEGEIYKSCAFAPDGRLLASTSADHIDVFEVGNGGFEPVETRTTQSLKSINDMYFMEGGDFFIIADNGIAYVDDADRYHLINTNAFNNSIDNMLVDYQGNLWFTSSRLGLFRMAPSSFKDVYTAAGLSSRVVNAVTRWRDSYYFGTDKGLDAVNNACRYPLYNAITERLRGSRIRCLLTDSRENMWVCTYGGGLLEFEKDGTAHTYSEEEGCFPRTRVVIELSDGTIAVGGNGGVCFIRDHQVIRTVTEHDGLPNTVILSLMETADGAVLAGTNGGGIAVLENQAITRVLKPVQNDEDGLKSGVVLRTVLDEPTGKVYIVASNGLCVMDTDYSIHALKNFPYYNNYTLWAREDGKLFVMSSSGIYVVDREDVLNDAEGMRYELLDAKRGLNGALTANAFSYYDGANALFLPCDKGVYIIDTEDYTAQVSRYRMWVPTIRLDGELSTVETGGPIEVEHDVSRIELYPEILNYSIQEPSVGYMLEGFDSQWTIMSQSNLGMIVYTNLPSGDYTLRLAVFDNNQTDILEERDFILRKERAIYNSRGFVIYLMLVPMLAVMWITWFIQWRQTKRAMEIQEHQLEIARRQAQMGNETVMAIARAVDAKDGRTSQHSKRVSIYSVQIARELGFSEKECENLRRAALLHDIGKIGIPDRILNKPDRLTDEEYAIMKSHVTRGAAILKEFTLIENVIDGTLYHHERYDGRGYPAGLKGEEIPVYGRIIGVADAFDAMTANRVYRRQMDFGYVLNEMRKGRGTQFDPQFVDILLKLIDDGTIDLNALYPQRADTSEKEGEA